jgi:hypothetical protein
MTVYVKRYHGKKTGMAQIKRQAKKKRNKKRKK